MQKKQTFELIGKQFLAVYNGQYTRKEAVERLCAKIEAYKPSTFSRYLDSFLHMMSGTLFVSVLPIDLSIFLLEYIFEVCGKDALQRALNAEKQHIQYYYNVSGNSQNGLCRQLMALAEANDISITFTPS